jgi:hypothetical protein
MKTTPAEIQSALNEHLLDLIGESEAERLSDETACSASDSAREAVAKIPIDQLHDAHEWASEYINHLNRRMGSSPQIIQLLIAPNDSTWQGVLLGLGDNGVTHHCQTGHWEPYIPTLGYLPNAQGDQPTV